MTIALDHTLLNAENCAAGDLALRDAYVQSFYSDLSRFKVVDHYIRNHVQFDFTKFVTDVDSVSAPHCKGSSVEFCQRALTSMRAMGQVRIRPDHNYEVVPVAVDTKLPHEFKHGDEVFALTAMADEHMWHGYKWVLGTLVDEISAGTACPIFTVTTPYGATMTTLNILPSTPKNRLVLTHYIIRTHHIDSDTITLGRAPSGYGMVPRIGDLDYFEKDDVVQYHFPLDIGNGKSGKDVYNLKQYDLKDEERGTIIDINYARTYGPMTIRMDSGAVVQCALPNRLSLLEYSHPFRLVDDKPARLK